MSRFSEENRTFLYTNIFKWRHNRTLPETNTNGQRKSTGKNALDKQAKIQKRKVNRRLTFCYSVSMQQNLYFWKFRATGCCHFLRSLVQVRVPKVTCPIQQAFFCKINAQMSRFSEYNAKLHLYSFLHHALLSSFICITYFVVSPSSSCFSGLIYSHPPHFVQHSWDSFPYILLRSGRQRSKAPSE